MAEANRAFFLPSRPEAAKGLWPHEYSVATGTILYRFVDATKRPPTFGADGPWWFEFEHFQTIKHFSMRHGYSLGYAARLFAAILYEWSEVNAVVRAEVAVPLKTWKGRGKQVIVGKDRPLYKPEIDPRDVNRTPAGLTAGAEEPKISKMTPMQGPNEVYQLYVPGLGPPHFQFSRYFKYLGDQQITTG
jgi:hypothetical protein